MKEKLVNKPFIDSCFSNEAAREGSRKRFMPKHTRVTKKRIIHGKQIKRFIYSTGLSIN